MYGEIITIGSELISGRIMDLNAWYAAGKLTAAGLKVTRITTVADDPEKVTRTLKEAVQNSHFVITTGGLGSTEDDLTNEIVANALDRPLCLDREMFEKIKGYVEARGMQMSPSLEKMAWMPKGSQMLNPEGTTCGFSMRENDIPLYFLPGVPDQMRYLTDKFVLPDLLRKYKTLPVLRHKILKFYGLSEPSIAEMLKQLPKKIENIILGFYPNFPENHVTISLRGHDEPTVMDELNRTVKEIRSLLGPFLFATEDQSMERVVGDLLRNRGVTIALAESCPGGLIGNLLTNEAGSSEYFQGGLITYSNQAKTDLLGVSPETLKQYGAVSDQTVKEMARGVREKMGTEMGLAISGIAGPGGGTAQKPVGTVHIGLAVNQESHAAKYRFWGTRKQIKRNAAMMALDWVRRYLHGYSFLPGI
jgi:nicotinamide-nucleotide amidase